ncbi:MAG: hypothetical protein ACRDMY_01785 [Gaiellaceae bacterium]
MSELGEALAAMSQARAAYRTLRATAYRRYDECLGPDAWARVEGLADDEDASEPGVSEHAFELSVEWPDRVDESWLAVLDPTGVLGACAFELAGSEVVAGRDAILLRARPLEADSFALGDLGPGADVYELAVDAERGILLRSVALLDGREYLWLELRTVEFDVELPPEEGDDEEPFEFDPEADRRPVTLEEAAAECPSASGSPTCSLGAGGTTSPSSTTTPWSFSYAMSRARTD